MLTILRKELADHFSSTRFLILFCLITMVAVVTTYMVGASLREGLEGGTKSTDVFLMLFTASRKFFSLSQFIALFGPLVGLVMGFDAINRERGAGTLSKLVSQPIFRDAVINGKFLAGVATIAIMLTALVLLVSALGMLTVGVVPGADEIARLVVYLVISIAYVSFWLGLSILFSILFRSIATSALAAVALWIFFAFFVPLGASLLADMVAPVENQLSRVQVAQHANVRRLAGFASPVELYGEATAGILDPLLRTTRAVVPQRLEHFSMNRFRNTLPLDQSILLVLPSVVSILSLTVVCFGISYLIFMRQEIRSA